MAQTANQEEKKARHLPTLTLVCSKHGVQRFVAFAHAQIVIECGCGWTNNNDRMVWSNESDWWALKDWKKRMKKKK